MARAVADCSHALDLDPNLALAWYNRGVFYGYMGQTAVAVADYTRALELNPKDVQAWNNRGLAYDQLGQTDRALDDLSQAIKLNPEHVTAWCGRGWVYLKLGQADKAVADFTRAIEVDPNYPELVTVYRLRAQAQGRLGRFEPARADYRAALERAPGLVWTNLDLAWLLATCPEVKLRDPQQAVALARKAVQLGPKSADCWRTLGVAQYRAGDWPAAAAALDQALQLGRGGGAAERLFLAMAHQKQGDPDRARALYEQAARWLEKSRAALEQDPGQAEELRRFRAEAEEVLGLMQ
jgi:tetratricopeptide (TPR) repeat protein